MKNISKSRINVFLAGAVVVVAVLQVVILNFNSTSGEKLRILNQQIKETENKNSILMQEIASSSAIATISLRAKEIGFIQNKQVLSLSSPQPIAFSHRPSL